jgi:phosphoribosylanthranilate isomerase
VDVVSGVEQAPGIKDYERLRAFMSVVRHDEEA